MRQGQTKRDSLLEATVNILIGYGVAIAAQKVIFPIFGMHVSTADDCKIAGLFTIISLIRSYVLRRLFNWWHVYKNVRAPYIAAVAAGSLTVNEARERMGLDPIINRNQ